MCVCTIIGNYVSSANFSGPIKVSSTELMITAQHVRLNTLTVGYVVSVKGMNPPLLVNDTIDHIIL